MSDFSLLPERQLQFSPLLAATIGLEEAILLQHLQQVFEHRSPELQGGYAWFTVERAFLLRTLPFWTVEDLHRISRNLVDKGVLLIATPPLLSAEHLTFAVNEPAPTRQPAHSSASVAASVTPPVAPSLAPSAAHTTDTSATQPAAHSSAISATHSATITAMPPVITTKRGAGLLPAHWSPSEDLLQLLAMNHNIPRQFALDQLEDFIFYWRDSNQAHTSWNSKFLQHVKYHWAKRHQIEHAGHSHAGQSGTSTTGRTRDRSLQQDLTDTSWAE